MLEGIFFFQEIVGFNYPKFRTLFYKNIFDPTTYRIIREQNKEENNLAEYASRVLEMTSYA